jgi:hypothetical protein
MRLGGAGMLLFEQVIVQRTGTPPRLELLEMKAELRERQALAETLGAPAKGARRTCPAHSISRVRTTFAGSVIATTSSSPVWQQIALSLLHEKRSTWSRRVVQNAPFTLASGLRLG